MNKLHFCIGLHLLILDLCFINKAVCFNQQTKTNLSCYWIWDHSIMIYLGRKDVWKWKDTNKTRSLWSWPADSYYCLEMAEISIGNSVQRKFYRGGTLKWAGLEGWDKNRAQRHWRKEEWWEERHGGGNSAPERRLTCLECKVWEGEWWEIQSSSWRESHSWKIPDC